MLRLHEGEIGAGAPVRRPGIEARGVRLALRICLLYTSMQATRFQVNDRVFAMDGFDCIRIPAMKNLWCMLNLAFFAETDTGKRAFAYLDSVCLSGDF